jgi:hypothetical protein
LHLSHELRTSSFSHGIVHANRDGDDNDSNSYSGGDGGDNYGGGGVDYGNGGGVNSDSGGHKQQTPIN